jgi:hypothetical protein
MKTMTTNMTLTPRLREIADKVKALSRMSKESGFSTKRSICQLLAPLTPDELVAVSKAAFPTEQ